MQYDYYAFQHSCLAEVFGELEKAAAKFQWAGDRRTRREAKSVLRKAAEKAVKIDPHLAYMWFWARKVEAKGEASDRASTIANSIRDAWQDTLKANMLPDWVGLIPDISVVKHMPSLSFMLHIPFQLEKPYISQDESDFYILDNPLRKERAFGTPMVAATSWKGALRAALWQLGYEDRNEVIIRLMGNPRKGDEDKAGRLHFYPTFFDDIGLEIVNPHDRETGTGKDPILMESVPKGVGTLALLYVPFGPIEQTDDTKRAEVAQDLEVVAHGIRAMLTTYGFGAKTSSGFGMTYEQLVSEGKLAVKAKLHDVTAPTSSHLRPERPTVDLPRYLVSPTQLHPDFCQPDSSLKPEEEYEALVKSRKGQYAKKNHQLYSKASFIQKTFSSLSELQELAKNIATLLREGGEA